MPTSTLTVPADLAAAIAARPDELDAVLATLNPCTRLMLAATAHTALPCPRCKAQAGSWCVSRRRGRAGQSGYSNSAVGHIGRHHLVDGWDEPTRVYASAIAGVHATSITAALATTATT